MKLGLYLLAALLSTESAAATIKSYNKKSRTIIIEPDDGEEFLEGQKVCIYSDEDKSLGCVSITSVDDDSIKASVKSLKKAKSLKTGLTVKHDKSKTSNKKKSGKNSAKIGKNNPWRFFLNFAYAPAPAATYQKLSYLAPTTATPESIWNQEQKPKFASGFDLRSSIPVSSLAVVVGLRMREYEGLGFGYDTNYVSGPISNPYVRTKHSATSYGGVVLAEVMRYAPNSMLALTVATGVDGDYSKLKFDTQKLTDDAAQAPVTGETYISRAESKLFVGSLRLDLGLELQVLGPAGGNLLLGLAKPVYQSQQISGSSANGEDHGIKDPKGDLKKSLAHAKANFSFEIQGGLALFF